MKIGGNLPGFNISAEGMSVQRKKMNLIAENIANGDTSRTEAGEPYRRKFLKVVQNENNFFAGNMPGNKIKMSVTENAHFTAPGEPLNIKNPATGLTSDELVDKSKGEMVYMPEHPNANSDGYIEMSNVNIITEMTDMIAATRSYEANLTALNSSKQIAKESLEI